MGAIVYVSKQKRSADMNNASILTMEERMAIPSILEKRKVFRQMMEAYITSYHLSFTNSMIIQGKAGSGKTTLVIENLDNMKSLGLIADYVRTSGHVTPSSLVTLLERTSQRENGLPKVLVLDDVDCMADEGCLELMKSAFDTKSNIPTNREVSYLNRKFKYNGYGVIITNDNMMGDNLDPHQKAIMDRAQAMSIDLELKDMITYTTYLIEEYLNSNPDNLTEEEIQNIVTLFDTEIREWIELGVFRRSRVSYSIRLIKKFVENQKMFSTKWKQYSTVYQSLSKLADTIRKEREMNQLVEEKREQTEQEIIANTKVSDLGYTIATPIGKLKIVNPKTGEYYSTSNLTYFKNKGTLVLNEADNHWYYNGVMVG